LVTSGTRSLVAVGVAGAEVLGAGLAAGAAACGAGLRLSVDSATQLPNVMAVRMPIPVTIGRPAG
jgi:hypothetical protein